MDSSPTRLFVVEDNPVDLRLLRYALNHERSWSVEFTEASDGEKAIHMLLDVESREGIKPDFVILDLNLPKRDGTEVLHVIRANELLRDLPVAILSSSPMDAIKGRMEKANVRANCYLTKPDDIDEFVRLGQQLHTCYEIAAEQCRQGNFEYEVQASDLRRFTTAGS